MPMKRGFVTLHIRESIESNDIALAVLRTSITLEQMLFLKLYFEKGIKLELMERWTLGRYMKWASSYSLIQEKWWAKLSLFQELRNLIVHEIAFVDRIKANKTELENVKKLLIAMCNLIDNTRIETNMELEKGHTAFFTTKNQALQKKMERIFSD